MDTDPLGLAQALIRCPSVTPRDAGALDVLQAVLEELGFTCHRLTFSDARSPAVDNLYARLGDRAPNFCFAGHTDVVPAGDSAAWSVDPFAGDVVDGHLVGRGSADMKGAIACFVAAVARFLSEQKSLEGSISLLITGDEEGPAVNGTIKVLEWLEERGERLDACLVGEPTSAARLGDVIKVGRRGSLTGRLTVRGTQGHTAYPRLADNPIPPLLDILSALIREPLDEGSELFEPSNLEITSIDVGNTATNVIPGAAHAKFNIRFNDRHTPESLEGWLRRTVESAAGGHAYDLEITVSGSAFVGEPGRLRDIVAESVAEITGATPDFSTAGGTSDARFIHVLCPVAEIGLVGRSMHAVNENVPLSDLDALTRIYKAVLDRFFAAA